MYPFRLFLKDKMVALTSLTMGLLMVGSWWFILSKIPKDADQVFLHYNIIFGVDLAGSWWKMLLLPAGATLIFLVNTIFAWIIFNRDKALARIILIGGVLASLVGLVSLVLIVGLNV